jgi:AraC-like DNA-binding protein
MAKDLGILPEAKALSSIIGEDAHILTRERYSVNKFIVADYLKIDLSDGTQLQDKAHLFLYPIEDGQYSLHLSFLQPVENSVQAEAYLFQFLPEFFDAFPFEMLKNTPPFAEDHTSEHEFNICSQTKVLLGQFNKIPEVSPLLQSLQQTELSIHLLRRAIENIIIPFTVCAVPACRFLAYESEREKIYDARTIMEQTFDQPLSIKELSRKVAMNECYLKKGFKTLTGKTINEYQQELRIAKARKLLQRQGQTVSEVASLLGYSSISHFSTAFKKATGLKPCELLG